MAEIDDFRMDIWCYPLSAIRKWTKRSFSIADGVDTLFVSGKSQGSQTPSTFTSSPSELDANKTAWKKQPYVKNMENLDVWDLNGVKGLSLRPVIINQNNVITGESNRPSGDSNFATMDCIVSKGMFTTILPDGSPKMTWIKHAETTKVGNTSDSKVAIGNLQRNESFVFRLRRFGTGHRDSSTASRVRVAWGNYAYSLLFPTDDQVSLQTRAEKTDPSQNIKVGDYLNARLFNVGAADEVYGQVYYLGGNLVVDLNGEKVVYQTEKHSIGKDDYELTPIAAVKGPVYVEGYGSKYAICVNPVRFGKWSKNPGLTTTGSLVREFDAARGPMNWGKSADQQAIGYRPEDSKASINVTPAGTAKWQYTFNVTAGRNGLDTPFITRIGVRYQGATSVASDDPINAGPYMLSANESVSEPAVQMGPEWDITFNRTALDEMFPDWRSYIGAFHPIEIDVGWKYRGVPTVDKYRRLYDGIIYTTDWNTPGYNKREFKITATDQTLLLRKPAGVIDHRYGPLDIYAGAISQGNYTANQRKPHPSGYTITPPFENNGKGAQSMMGWEAVMRILATAIGEEIADNLRVYLDQGHYGLATHKFLSGVQHSGGWLWPAPWGQDPYSWLRQFCEIDFAEFYFAPTEDPVPGSPTRGMAYPTYGNYYNIVPMMPTVHLYDGNYTENVVGGIETANLYEHDFNRFLVWGRFPNADMSNLPFPAPIMREAIIIDNAGVNPKAANVTFERTTVVEGPHMYLPQYADRIVQGLANQWNRVDVARKVFTLPLGLPLGWWGSKVIVHQPQSLPLSDTDHNVDGQAYRVVRMTQNYRRDQKWKWTAQLRCFPVNASTGW